MKSTIFSLAILLFGSSTGFSQTFFDHEQVEQMIHRGSFDSTLVLVENILAKDSMQFSAALYQYLAYRHQHEKEDACRIASRNAQRFLDDAQGLNRLRLLLHLAESSLFVRKNDIGNTALQEAQVLLNELPAVPTELQLYARFISGLKISNERGLGEPKLEKSYLATFAAIDSLPEMDPQFKGELLRQLAIINRIKGDFEKAGDYIQQALHHYQDHYPADHFDIGVAHYSSGNIHYELMEYQQALDHYLPAYEIWKNYYTPSEKFMRYLTEATGDMYWELGQKEKALPFYNLSVVGKKNKIHQKIQHLQLADSMAGVQHYTEAMDIYSEALKFRQGLYGDKHPLTGACQNQIARAYFSKGEYDAALEAYQMALTMLVKDFNDTIASINPSGTMQVLSEQYLVESMYGKTLALQKIYQQEQTSENLQLAFQTSVEAIQILENLRQSPLAEGSKSFWTRKYFALFDIALELAHQRYGNGAAFVEQAFPIIESSKAFLLQNALRFGEESTFIDVPEGLLEKERQLKKSIRQYVIRIDQEERLCENAQQKKLEIWNEELFALKLQYQLFVESLKTSFPDYYHLKYEHQTLSLEAIKTRILSDEQSLLIEYFEGEKYIFALAFTQQGSFSCRLSKDSLFTKRLQAFTRSFYDINAALAKPIEQFNQFSTNAQFLYQQLLAPILSHFPDSIQQITIIPDKSLFYLPFESLLQGELPQEKDYRRLPYLLHRYQFNYSQSADILARAYSFPSTKKNRYNYLGFAPSQFEDQGHALPALHWNKNEVTEADKLWPGKTFTGAQATKQAFLDHSKSGKIQHFATHALIDNENPMLSRIVFQGDSNNVLYTSDLYSLPLHAELLILNACNVAQGKWEQGEGMISLESIFQYTGCRALLTSTWALDDKASSIITVDFLDFLQQGAFKNKALAAAKRNYLASADPAFAHPYYWAGLRLTGNIAPVLLSTTDPAFYFGAAFLVLSLSFFGFRFLRRSQKEQ